SRSHRAAARAPVHHGGFWRRGRARGRLSPAQWQPRARQGASSHRSRDGETARAGRWLIQNMEPRMNALGLIEVKGWSPAMVVLDTLDKAADVTLLQVELNDLYGA